jgi:dihydrofolate reductase / thymidylate synthase
MKFVIYIYYFLYILSLLTLIMQQNNKPIHCILATDFKGGIAIENDTDTFIPWNCIKDMKRFKDITTMSSYGKKNVVIMGRKTWEKIPEKHKPLEGRVNVVISSIPEQICEHDYEDLHSFSSPELAINFFQNIDWINDIFIIGGVSLYEKYINSSLSSKLYLTTFSHDYLTNVKVKIDFDRYNLVHRSTDHYDDTLNKMEIVGDFEEYDNISKFNNEENNYLLIMRHIVDNGHHRDTRNGMTFSNFGKFLEFNLENGAFPLLTTKKVFVRGIFEELKFFLQGKTDSKILEEKNVNIWKGNTSREFLDSIELTNYKEGDMGPMYGFQLLHFNASYDGCDKNYHNKGINQIQNVIEKLTFERYSRRILMTTYNPSQEDLGVLYPCHGIAIQFGIESSNKLCCHMHQRSADWFLGVPFNIASYAILIHIMCNIVNNNLKKNISDNEKLIPGKLTMSFGDVHLYDSHIDVAKTQLSRSPHSFPTLKINKNIVSLKDIDNLNFTDLEISNYVHEPPIKANMVC